jgi:hypothetical protein
MMRKILTSLLLLLGVGAMATKMTSPNGKLSVVVEGQLLKVSYQQRQVLEIIESRLGTSVEALGGVKDDYRMLTGKRSHCQNAANEYRCGSVQLRVYNDGIALRTLSVSPQSSDVTYRIPEGTRRWMQQWCDSYEGFFPLSTTYKVAPVPSYSGISKSAEGWNNRWAYPALLEPVDGTFVLISEANIQHGQSASCLYNDGEQFKVVPAEQELPLPSEKAGEKASPWRVAIIGTLKDIVESTLVTDVSAPNKIADTSWIQPGVVSWIYWAYNHGSNDYQIIKKYVDMAEKLRLSYVLIDAEWDDMNKLASNEGKTIEDAVAYAKSKGVKPLIWYNSSIGWVDGAPTPKFRLNKPEDREKEFAWCEKIGVAGVKIDFFSGDNQRNMDFQLDLLESAARHHLLVNFHGATIPRGWQRTWPNLMSTEGVYGAEWYNNVGTFTNKAACHNATLPFTRNVIGPMDYTPCTFSDSQHPHITTHGHELALTVLFESGLQHLADRPESYLTQPQEVQDFLSALPAAWDETRFVAGYPGEYVILARRSGNKWYLAGINGTDSVKEVPLDFHGKKVTLFTDEPGKDRKWHIEKQKKTPKSVIFQPRGGFCYIWENR